MYFYEKPILKLNPNEVFVFGSNLDGFHGAGAAGFATFNRWGNIWREMGYDKWPHGTKEKWNVKGNGVGPQRGEIGKSYALPTVVKAGAKRSLSLGEIGDYITELKNFMLERPNLRFYITQGADAGLNGYSAEEMAQVFIKLKNCDNAYFKKDFYDIIN